MRRLVCFALLVGVSVVCGVSTDRFLSRTASQTETRTETSVTTSNGEAWQRFWGYMQEKFPDMDVEERKFRGLGNSGATYTVPTDTGLKAVKVRTTVTWSRIAVSTPVSAYESYGTLSANRVPARVPGSVDIPSHETLNNALTAYRTKYRDDPRAAWADAFVQRTVYHDKEIGYQFELMEYVSGVTLEEYTKTSPQLSVDQVNHLVRQLTQILYVLAFGRFTHEDLHPGNIMVTATGRLVVIDLERSHLCSDRTGVILGKNEYMAYEYHLRHAVHRDTCVALDAYSMGVTILSLVSRILPEDSVNGASRLNFRATALARLEAAVLSADDEAPAKVALREELQRVLGWLLEDHGAARTVSTFALFDHIFKGSYAAPASTPAFVVVVPEPDNSWDPEKNFKVLPSVYEQPSDAISSGHSAAKNALVDYMKGVTADSFPAGPAILRRSTIEPSYLPHILFQNGLHSTVPSDSDLSDGLRANIFLLQQKYRHKLVLQVTSDAALCPTVGILPSESQDMIYIAVGSPSSHDEDTTRFEFTGQPVFELLSKVQAGKSVHASLLNWNNEPVVGGCLGFSSKTILALHDSDHRERKGYTFKLSGLDTSTPSLIMTPPKVLIVGGGPTGLVAALEAKASAAAVKIWERRTGYTRMYCQACDVNGYLKDVDMTTDKYLKSVEDTLAAIAITVGVNLQFQREFLYLDDAENVATGRVVSGTTMWFADRPWTKLKQKTSKWKDLRQESFDVLIGADGTSSSIRSQYLKSPFLDRVGVRTQGGRRTLTIKTTDDKPVPIRGITTLQFVKGACARREPFYPDPSCISDETGFNAMWQIQRKSSEFCFFEYIENLRGTRRVQKIIQDHRIAQDGQEFSRVLKTPSALNDVYQMMLARYVAYGEHTRRGGLSSLALSHVRDGEGCLTRRPASHRHIEEFKSIQENNLFSMFWLRTRDVTNGKYASKTAGGGVVAIVGDATRDSFFPFGNGMNEHIRAMTELHTPPGFARTPIQKSAVGALVRGDMDVAGYNAHMEPLIKDYMRISSLVLVGMLTCVNEPRLSTELSAARMKRLAHLISSGPVTEIAQKCPYLQVVDTPPAREPDSEPIVTTAVLDSPVVDAPRTEIAESVGAQVDSVPERVDPKADRVDSLRESEPDEELVFDENAPTAESRFDSSVEPETVDIPLSGVFHAKQSQTWAEDETTVSVLNKLPPSPTSASSFGVQITDEPEPEDV